jgi:hypothetical protein
VNVGDVTEVPEVHAASIFVFEVCRVSKFIDVHVGTFRKRSRERVVVGVPSAHTGVGTDVYRFLKYEPEDEPRLYSPYPVTILTELSRLPT